MSSKDMLDSRWTENASLRNEFEAWERASDEDEAKFYETLEKNPATIAKLLRWERVENFQSHDAPGHYAEAPAWIDADGNFKAWTDEWNPPGLGEIHSVKPSRLVEEGEDETNLP